MVHMYVDILLLRYLHSETPAYTVLMFRDTKNGMANKL
jgi:hypothetical protein